MSDSDIRVRPLLLTSAAMIAFAANSILCRLALENYGLDAASFTSVRLASGAAALWLLSRAGRGSLARGGDWTSGAVLFVYAAGFSWAYAGLSAAAGALLLFGAVQTTMIFHALRSGERIGARRAAGFVLASGGLAALLLPGLSAPSPGGAALMLAAGTAWGVYTLRGKGVKYSAAATAGNFIRALPFALAVSLLTFSDASFNRAGVVCAVLSGAIASGIGYTVWYSVLPALKTTTASIVQLTVPVLTALGGIAFLGEPLTPRLILASIPILGGTALAVSGGGHREGGGVRSAGGVFRAGRPI